MRFLCKNSYYLLTFTQQISNNIHAVYTPFSLHDMRRIIGFYAERQCHYVSRSFKY